MRNLGIVGGETHIKEVTRLAGKDLRIVAAAVRADQTEWAGKTFNCPVVTDYRELLKRGDIDLLSVANENDGKAEVILAGLEAGCDIVVDKPLAITPAEQEKIEAALARRPQRKLVMLLTLRGDPQWAGLQRLVQGGAIGTSAFTHVRMAVQLKRKDRPPWFLDHTRSGGVFLDLLIHGLDYLEWLTGRRVTAMTATMGNLGEPDDRKLKDHAAVFCEMDDGSSAVVEGQRMLPDAKGSDYRVLVAGTKGYADLLFPGKELRVTSPAGADQVISDLPAPTSVVADWLAGGTLVDQAASLRANRLAVLATVSAADGRRIEVK